MKRHLSSDQWALYQAEVDKRNASRKQAAIRYLVDSLDRDLYLSDQQRDKLTDSLSSHWDDRWHLYLEYVFHGNPFYPLGVDPIVTPLLSDVQRKVWQGFQKVGGFWGFGGMFGGFMNDNDALEEELGEVRKADPANPREAGSHDERHDLQEGPSIRAEGRSNETAAEVSGKPKSKKIRNELKAETPFGNSPTQDSHKGRCGRCEMIFSSGQSLGLMKGHRLANSDPVPFRGSLPLRIPPPLGEADQGRAP